MISCGAASSQKFENQNTVSILTFTFYFSGVVLFIKCRILYYNNNSYLIRTTLNSVTE